MSSATSTASGFRRPDPPRAASGCSRCVPLFAAASSHYTTATGPRAPRLVTLDEALAGVDDDSRASASGCCTPSTWTWRTTRRCRASRTHSCRGSTSWPRPGVLHELQREPDLARLFERSSKWTRWAVRIAPGSTGARVTGRMRPAMRSAAALMSPNVSWCTLLLLQGAMTRRCCRTGRWSMTSSPRSPPT
ncbi:SbcC/MukB-like Walker B domain-containing protein [Streptomyces sp. NPDC004647]|uniref:SbcC/MukB-like Walker B domain-containing protein n=1 Tax=Streptomyces sp. NPDC004647 TaxID=3154671 RepID=UPI0033BB9D26